MTRIPRGITARRFIKALNDDGFVLDRTSDRHRIYLRAVGRRVIVACHCMHDGFPLGTLSRMIDDCGWSDEDLRRLGLCR